MAKKAIYIADHDTTHRNALECFFKRNGYEPILYETGRALLDGYSEHGHHPLLLELHMPDQCGIEILKSLNPEKYNAPIIMISKNADIPTAVRAIRSGAYDFIEKPLNEQDVFSCIEKAALEFKCKAAKPIISRKESCPLTPRENDVLNLITSGKSNREAGAELSISPRTVEVHRARIMSKLGAKNAADLVRKLYESRS